MTGTVTVRLLADGDQALLASPAPDVFDDAVAPALADAFLKDPRHHIAAAIAGGRIVGFVSAIDHLHPDKPPQLFIAEAGVAPPLQRRGIGARLMRAMLDHGRALGCTTAWVATEEENAPARALYAAMGGIPDDARAVVFTFALDAPR